MCQGKCMMWNIICQTVKFFKYLKTNWLLFSWQQLFMICDLCLFNPQFFFICILRRDNFSTFPVRAAEALSLFSPLLQFPGYPRPQAVPCYFIHMVVRSRAYHFVFYTNEIELFYYIWMHVKYFEDTCAVDMPWYLSRYNWFEFDNEYEILTFNTH